ncbi:MAG: glycosyltransferase family 9 protein [Bacteroidota bacterium]|nr:glycosyltransferase family 9 protein [Bacteroidota bacterium]
MNQFEDFLKRFLLQVIGILRPVRKTLPRELPINRFKRILIVRQHDQLGDLLISTPTIRAVRKRYPNAYIAVVVREYTAPMVWDNPHVDEIIVFHEKLQKWNLSVLRSFLGQLRKDGGFDIAIMLNTVSRSFSSDLIALAAKSKYIIGPNHLKLVPDLPEKIYNILSPRTQKLQLEIEHNLDIVKTFGVPPDGYDYDLTLDDEEITEAAKIHYNLKISSGMTIGVHFGTLDVTRRFPLVKLAKVIDWIKSHDEYEVVLIVGPNEIKLHQELLRMIKSKVLSAPVMSLRVSAAFIKRMDLFICNDTGTLHIASAMQVPTVSFHSLNDPAVWKPPHERHIAVRAEDKKITSITVEQAIEAVKIQIERIKSAPL